MDYENRRQRKAISPVLATVILVAITLIAAVAIGGFVFGLMGTFTSTAVVDAQTVICSGTPENCVLTLYNTGTANTSLLGMCQLNFGGGYYAGTAHLMSGALGAGSTSTVSCVSNTAGSHAPIGAQVTGWVTIASGAEVLFAAEGN